MNHVREAGFTLLELITVIIIVALASVPILGQFTQVAGSTLLDEEIQTAAQLAQERAEAILALRRDQGYAAVAIGTTSDVLTGNYGSYSRSVSVTEPPAGGGCAAGATCKGIVVSVDRGPSNRATVSFVLVDY
jgi:prepilin-type N-terminal cleavage/methylation domain-containing protein